MGFVFDVSKQNNPIRIMKKRHEHNLKLYNLIHDFRNLSIQTQHIEHDSGNRTGYTCMFCKAEEYVCIHFFFKWSKGEFCRGVSLLVTHEL